MSESKPAPMSRRRVFAGVGAAGALAGVAALVKPGESQPPVAQSPQSAPEAGGGYQLTAHVQRYYQTARV